MLVTNWLRGFVYRFGYRVRRRAARRLQRSMQRTRQLVAMAWAPEPLEERVLLAVSSATQVGGDLTIVTNNDSHIYTLLLTANDEVRVFDNDAFDQTFSGVTGTLTFTGGTANDVVTLDLDAFSLGANVAISTGAGDDDVVVQDGGTITGDVMINVGTAVQLDDDYIRLYDVTTNGNVTLSAGDGDDEFVVDNVEITGNVSIDGGDATTGNANYIDIDNTDVTGQLTLTGGDGDDDFSVDFSTITGDVAVNLGGADAFNAVDMGFDAGPVSIGGNLTITAGDSDDDVFLDAVDVTGSASINTGNADTYDVVNLYDVGIGVDLTITTGDGDDLAIVTDSSIGGDLMITTGSGEDEVYVDPTTIAGNVTISTGSEDDLVDLRDVDVVGDLSINTDGGSDTIRLYTVGVDGNLTVEAGDSDDFVDADGVDVGLDVIITSTAGNLFLTSTFDDLSSTSGSISVQAQGSGSLLSMAVPLSALAGNVSLTADEVTTVDSVDAPLGSVTVIADELSIGQTISAPTGVVTIQQKNAGQAIDLGTDGIPGDGVLGLTDAELDQVTADVLRIGDLSNSGNIAVSSLIAPVDTKTLTLRTAGSIVDNHATLGVDLVVEAIALQAGGSIGDSANPLEVDADFVAFESGGATHIESTTLSVPNGLTIVDDVDVLGPSSAAGGSFTASSPLTIRVDVNLTGSFTFTAGESDTAGDNLVINNDATVSLVSGTPSALMLIAGDDIQFGDGASSGQVSTSGAAHVVNLIADTEGAGADATRGAIVQDQSVAAVTTQTLDVDAAGGIGSLGAEFIFDAQTLTTSSTGGGISSAQNLVEANTVEVLSIDAGSSDARLSGGTFVLLGTATAGELFVGPAGAATLGGTGTVDAQLHVVDGSVAPGLSPGILNVTGDVFLDSTNGALDVEIGGTTPGTEHDQLDVTGGVTIDGADLNLSLINAFVPAVGVSFVIVDNDGVDPVGGPGFDGLAEGDVRTVSGSHFQISYVGGDGNDVVLTTVAFASGADLEVTKDDTPDLVNPGEQITYTITVTNNGPEDAADVTLTDVVPTNTTYVSFAEEAGWTVSMEPSVGGTGPVQATIATLPNGATATFTLVVLVDNDAEMPISNVASVQTSTNDPDPGNDSATEETDVTPPDFDFGDAPDPTYPTLNANNGAKHKIVGSTPFLGTVPPDVDADGQPTADADGDDTDGGDDEDGVAGLGVPFVTGTMNDITVTVDDGGGTAYLNAWVDYNGDGDWDDAGEQIATDLVLATGGHTITLDVPMDAAIGDTYARFRFATEAGLGTGGRTEDGEVEDYVVTIVPPIPLIDLIVEKSESVDPVIAGSGTGNLTYTVTLTNDGPSDVNDVVIAEDLTLPAGVTFVSATPSFGTFTPTGPGSDGTWSIDFLAVGESETLTIVLTAGPATAHGATVSNTASVASIGVDQLLINEGDDTATESTTVQREVDLVVSKTESADPVVAGTGVGNLTHTVTVTNAGPSNATGVALHEDITLPPGVSVVSITPSQGTFTTTTSPDGNWNVGSLASGASAMLTVVYTVSVDTLDGLVVANTATLNGATETLINTGNDSATAETTVQNELGNLVLNVTPMINEGDTATLTGSFLNEPQSHSVSINWGDGQSTSLTLAAGTYSFTATHKYLDDTPSGTTQDPFTPIVTISDASSDTVVGSTTLIVKNVPPVFTSLTANPTSVQSGGQTTLSGTFSDPGTPDTHLVDLDLNNDGTFEQLGNPVSGGSFSFNINVNQPPGDQIINLRIRDDDFGSSTSTLSITITPTQNAVVSDSRLFYNNSAFDGNNPAGNAADVNAIDTTKVPVGIGQVSTFASISGSAKGINGVTFLVSALPNDGAGLTAADFGVRVGTTNNVNAWAAGPAPTLAVLANSGPGGEDRILLTFADNSIQDTYGEFQILATANTGLAAVHRAIFGNVRGDTGAAFVGQGQFFGRDAADLQAMVPPLFQPAGVTSTTDVTKDGTTNAFDLQVIPVASTAAVGGAFQSNVIPVITPAFAAVPAPGFAAAAAVDEAVADEAPIAETASFPTAAPGDGRVGTTGGNAAEGRDLAFATFDTAGDTSGSDLLGALATDRMGL